MTKGPKGRTSRPVQGSRGSTARPRALAGRSSVTEAPDTEALDASAPETEVDSPTPVDTQPPAPATDETRGDDTDAEETAAEKAGGDSGSGPSRVDLGAALASPRTTRWLVVAVVAMALVVGGLAGYLTLRPEPAPSQSRPIVASDAVQGDALSTASEYAAEILSTRYDRYDEQLAGAKKLMTPGFASEYGDTVAGIRDAFVKEKTVLDVTVVGSSVVRAEDDQVQTLLFLNQTVRKAGAGSKVTPYRALVTMDRTDRGWLVSRIETR